MAFIGFRNSFTLIQGKRDRKRVTMFIYWGRKLTEVFIYFLIPALLLLEVIKTDIQALPYWLGIILSVAGLALMASTRFYRNKDWGFMGDDSGDTLFTGGVYRFTRHPYYVGAILAGAGIYLQLNYAYALLMLPVIFFIFYVIKKEDGFLEERFGQKYLEYKSRVGVFPWRY